MDKKVKTEAIIIDDNTEVPEVSKHKKGHTQHARNGKQKPKRRVKINSTAFNRETLVVTHWVKPKFECIINVTNMYEDNRRRHKDRKREHKVCKHKERNSKNCKRVKLSKSSSEERIVPHCLRRCCKSAIMSKTCRNRRRKYRLNKRETISNNSYNYSCFSKYKTYDHQPISVPTNMEFEAARKGLRQADISYDDISSDSLSLYVDDKLEKLIKRTKKRERKLNMTHKDQVPVYARTAKQSYSADIDDAIVQNEANTSPHSMVTLVLETRSNVTPVTSPRFLGDFEDMSSYSPPLSPITSLASQEVYSPTYAAKLSPVHDESEQDYKPALSRPKKEYTPCATVSSDNYSLTKIVNPAVKSENVTTSLVCTKSEHVEDGTENPANYMSALNRYTSMNNSNLSQELGEYQNTKIKAEVFDTDFMSIKVEKDYFCNNNHINQDNFSHTSVGINYALVNVKQEPRR